MDVRSQAGHEKFMRVQRIFRRGWVSRDRREEESGGVTPWQC